MTAGLSRDGARLAGTLDDRWPLLGRELDLLTAISHEYEVALFGAIR